MKVAIYACDNVPEGLWDQPTGRYGASGVDCSNVVPTDASYSEDVVSSSADNFRDLIEKDVSTVDTEYVLFLHARHRLSRKEIFECIVRHRESGASVSVFPCHASVGAEWQQHLENIDQRIILSNALPLSCRPHPKAVIPFIGIAANAALLTDFALALRSRSIDHDDDKCRTSESVSIMLTYYLRLQSKEIFCHGTPVLSADFRGSDAKDVPNFLRRSFILGLHESLARQIGGDKVLRHAPRAHGLNRNLSKLSSSDLLWRFISASTSTAKKLYKLWKTPLSELIHNKGFVDNRNVSARDWRRVLDYGAAVTPFSRPSFARSVDSAYIAGFGIPRREAREIFRLLSSSKVTDISFKRFEVSL